MEVNIAELLIACGFGTVIRHQYFEERSNYYDALLSAESCAIAEKKGIHSSKDFSAMHIADLTMASAKKPKISCHFCNIKGFLPLWNMSSVIIGLNCLFPRRRVVLLSHSLVLGALAVMSLCLMKQLLL